MRIRYSFSSRKTGIIEGTNKHKQPFPKIVREVITLADIILEILDARFINQTRNPELEAFVQSEGKKLIYVLNKADLVDDIKTQEEVDQIGLTPYVFFSCTKKIGRNELRKRIQIEAKRLKLKRKVLVGIIGYPNTGKSSLMNVITRRASAPVSPISGHTKGIQKVRFTQDIAILDSPGVIPDNEGTKAGKEVLVKHTAIGIRRYDSVKDPALLVVRLMREYPGVIESHYRLSLKEDEDFLEILGKKKNFLKKKGIVDIDRTARSVLKDWQEGTIKG